MSRVAYVNGRYVRLRDAKVHIQDRGYQLADGVYEVWAVMNARLADAAGHFERLSRSLRELSIPAPMDHRALAVVLKETVRRNAVREGLCYLQVTRGVARRDHAFPTPAPDPAMVVTAHRVDRAAAEARAERGVAVVTTPEIRWGRCDIKTIGLLPNVLAKQKARQAGAVEAWFVDAEGLVTEGASSNAWIIDERGKVRTRDIHANILRGITRSSLFKVLEREGLQLEERPFTPEEAKRAREAFMTGAGSLLLPIVRIDDQPIGDGRPGPVAKRLRRLYIEEAERTAL